MTRCWLPEIQFASQQLATLSEDNSVVRSSYHNNENPYMWQESLCGCTGDQKRPHGLFWGSHYCDVIMGAMASQITSLTIAYSSVCSRPDQRKPQNSASLVFVRGIHRWPLKSPPKGPGTRKMFPFDDVIMRWCCHIGQNNVAEMFSWWRNLSHQLTFPFLWWGKLTHLASTLGRLRVSTDTTANLLANGVATFKWKLCRP